MPFCANCGADVAADAAYCPRCGFKGTVAARPVMPAPAPSTYASSPGRVLLPLRRLSWGLILLCAYMGVIAWAGIQETFFPAPPTPPVYFIDMTAPLLLANVMILLVPFAMLLFLGLGVQGLRAEVPEVRDHMTWRLGSHTVTATRLITYLFAAIILSFFLEAGIIAAWALIGGAAPDLSLFLGASFEAFIVAFGWCLMVFPAKALGPWTTPVETEVVSLAILLITAAALFDVAMQFVVAFVPASSIASSAGSSMGPIPPWAQGFSALGAFAGVLAVAWINRRIVHRMRRAPDRGVPAAV